MKNSMLAAGLALVMWTGSANAGSYWSAISTGCVPDNLSIQFDRYQPLSDIAVQHKPTNVDPIVLVCGVTPNAGAANPTKLAMTYVDSAGANAQNYTKAQLVRLSRTTGARSVVATLASTASAATTLGQRSVNFTHTLNFDTGYYFVRIEMDRSVATATIRTFGVALDNASP